MCMVPTPKQFLTSTGRWQQLSLPRQASTCWCSASPSRKGSPSEHAPGCSSAPLSCPTSPPARPSGENGVGAPSGRSGVGQECRRLGPTGASCRCLGQGGREGEGVGTLAAAAAVGGEGGTQIDWRGKARRKRNLRCVIRSFLLSCSCAVLWLCMRSPVRSSLFPFSFRFVFANFAFGLVFYVLLNVLFDVWLSVLCSVLFVATVPVLFPLSPTVGKCRFFVTRYRFFLFCTLSAPFLFDAVITSCSLFLFRCGSASCAFLVVWFSFLPTCRCGSLRG